MKTPLRTRLAAVLAACVALAAPHTGFAQENITVKPKPLSATYKNINSQVIKMDILFNGKSQNRAVKNQKLVFDFVEDRAAKSRVVTFSGNALNLMVADESFAALGVKSMALIEVDGAKFINLVGARSVCVKQSGSANGLSDLIKQMSPDTLLKQTKVDSTSFKGKLVKAEKVGGLAAKKYDVLTLDKIADPNNKQFIWIADKGEYIVKFEMSIPSKTGGKSPIAQNFEGDQRLTYSIISINKPVKIALPTACKKVASQ